MNATDYSFFLNKPNAINEKNSLLVDKIVYEFPYFQSARALQLKTLYNQDSFRYNDVLKKTAAFTTDRSVLFEFITSAIFSGFQTKLLQEKTDLINNITVNWSETITILPEISTEKSKIEQSILNSIIEATPKESETDIQTEIEHKLEIGKPLQFEPSEKHSFQEWLQLSQYKPINRAETETNIEAEIETKTDKISQIDIINRFIETNPKISPVNKDNTISIVSDQNSQDNSMLMTETLAKVYLEQKKYQKAIQAFEILILKYPEKSSFFANRISDIKILQQNNN